MLPSLANAQRLTLRQKKTQASWIVLLLCNLHAQLHCFLHIASQQQ